MGDFVVTRPAKNTNRNTKNIIILVILVGVSYEENVVL